MVKEILFYLSGLGFPPASDRTISVLQWADVDTEIWRAGWLIPDRNNKRRFNTSVNRPGGPCYHPMPKNG